jgi:hypothetical protein
LIRVKIVSMVVPHMGLNGETGCLYKISTDILFRELRLEKPRRWDGNTKIDVMKVG